MIITIINDSIVKQQVNAIVNPSNSFGHMGGGVAEVLKQMGGDQIEEEAISLAPFEIGTSVLTTGGDLKCSGVIHSPTIRDPSDKADLWSVEEATRAALELADQNEFVVIAMPGMGTGVGGVPLKEAALVMMKTISEFKPKFLEEVVLVDINEEMVDAWKSVQNI